MNTTVIKIGGMTCGGCVRSITRALTALPGVAKAEVTLHPAQAVIEFDADRVSRARLDQAVEDAGFALLDGNGS